MPIELPNGLLPRPISFSPDELLTGSAVVGFDFEVLDADDQLIGELDGVGGGGLDWTLFTGVKGSGKLEVSDVGQEVDWLNDRIRPVVHLSSGGATIRTPLGIYVCAAPDERWRGGQRSYDVDLMDKCSVLDQDIVTDENGNPVRYAAPAGSNIVELVVDLIQGVGEATPAIDLNEHTVALANSMVWDVGESVLTIVNELLEVGGYTSLWLDSQGDFRVSPYVAPAERDPIYSQRSPFTVGASSVVAPEWSRTRDFYRVPNRYVAIGVGSEEEEAPMVVVTNTDAASPYSFQSRKNRWITRVVTGVEAASLVELESRARMGLAQASSVTSSITLNHRFLPDLRLNSLIRFYHPAGGVDLLAYVTKTSVPFRVEAMCQSEIREAIA